MAPSGSDLVHLGLHVHKRGSYPFCWLLMVTWECFNKMSWFSGAVGSRCNIPNSTKCSVFDTWINSNPKKLLLEHKFHSWIERRVQSVESICVVWTPCLPSILQFAPVDHTHGTVSSQLRGECLGVDLTEETTQVFYGFFRISKYSLWVALTDLAYLSVGPEPDFLGCLL